jgi:hypothetical protein
MKALEKLLLQTKVVNHKTIVRGAIQQSCYDEKLDKWVYGEVKLSNARAVTTYWTVNNEEKIYFTLSQIKSELSAVWEHWRYNDAIAFKSWMDKNNIKHYKN